ncbi:hypothetical protein GCM10010174_34920 [Kutzneria viridogrisea]|uniref:Uncharacterized protein n=1 Tax=Kutzneria viridogrisea TaxID=47990 RepID=A0ABR6BLB6_9PSEU|nr:hypothetical protein [Kutzneria viridogrisea]
MSDYPVTPFWVGEVLGDLARGSWFRSCTGAEYFTSDGGGPDFGVFRSVHQEAGIVEDLHCTGCVVEDGEELFLIPDGEHEPVWMRQLVLTAKGRELHAQRTGGEGGGQAG